MNLIRLKQTAKKNSLSTDQNENTEEAIKKAEKDFALDLPLLADETARDIKILNAIAAIEKQFGQHILSIPRPPTASFHPIRVVFFIKTKL